MFLPKERVEADKSYQVEYLKVDLSHEGLSKKVLECIGIQKQEFQQGMKRSTIVSNNFNACIAFGGIIEISTKKPVMQLLGLNALHSKLVTKHSISNHSFD